jgi:hypothetical protein
MPISTFKKGDIIPADPLEIKPDDDGVTTEQLICALNSEWKWSSWAVADGSYFRFGKERPQSHLMIAKTERTFIYRDPQGRLQEAPHCDLFAA